MTASTFDRVLKFILICLAAFALPGTPLHAQFKTGQERIDSIKSVLPTLSNDTAKVTDLTQISYIYATIGEADKGLAWGKKAQELAIKIAFKKGEGLAYMYIGKNYWIKHDYLEEQKYCLQALNIFRQINDKNLVARSINYIGNIYETENDYAKALGFYQQALAIAREIKNYDEELDYLAYNADLYNTLKDYNKAIDCYKQIEQFLFTYNQNQLGGIYRRMGLVFANQGNFVKAFEYEKKGMLINEGLKQNNTFKFQYKHSLLALGIVYFQQGNYNQALVYVRKALHEFKLLSDVYSKNYVGTCLNKIGAAYLKMAGQMPKGNALYDAYIKKAEDTMCLAIKWLKPRDWTGLTEALQNLSAIYQASGNYKQALKAYQQYLIYNDSLNNNEVAKKIIVQEMEYEYGRQRDSIARDNLLHSSQLQILVQQKELDNLKGKQQRIYIIAAFIAVCLFASYFLYHNHLANKNLQNELANEKIGKQLQAAEHEKDISRTTLTALIAQMNPHFLFNALNTIQSFIYSNDKKNASNYLGKFSDLTRKILHNSGKKNISLDEEITLLQLYLDIEKVRFGESFEASVQVDQDLDAEGIFFPPMLVQPYVENAIKNGLLHKQGKKQLTVNIEKIANLNGIKITIDDNGIGREKSFELNNHNKAGHQSFASTATLKRIDLINQTLDKKITLNVIDKKNMDGFAIGTTVVIIIPT